MIRTLMERDGLTYEAAKQKIKSAVMECKNLIMKGCSMEEVWDAWSKETGLEPDYLDGLLY